MSCFTRDYAGVVIPIGLVMRRYMGLAMGVAFATVSGLAEAQLELPYLYQQLDKSTYRKALYAVLAGQPHLPTWVGRYLQVHDGVDVPGRPIVAEGRVAEAYAVCQPHNCGGSELHVIYAPGGGRAWVLLVDDNQRRFFGNPSSGLRTALLSTIAP